MKSARTERGAGRPLLNADAPGAEVIETDVSSIPLPAELLDNDEIILYYGRPSLLSVPLSCALSLASIAGVTFFLAWLSRYALGAGWGGIGWTDTQALLLGMLLACIRVGWQALDWFGRVHVLTDRRLITRTGVLRMVVFQTSLKRLQHTTIFCRVRERFFGLGTIAFATAGSDTFETFWVMVRNPVEVQRKVLDAMNRYGGHGKGHGNGSSS